MWKLKAIVTAAVFLAAWNDPASAQTTAGATPARTQTAPVAGSVADLDERSAVLDGLIRELEANRKVLFSGTGEVMVIKVDQLHNLAKWMVTSGKMSAPDAAIWTNEQLTASNRGIGALKEELATIHRMRDNARDRDQIGGGRVPSTPTASPAAPPGTLLPPAPEPIEWQKVRGSVSGTYLAYCRNPESTAPPEVRGEFTISLFGDGTVTASYSAEIGGNRFPTAGRIDAQGNVSGSGKASIATYSLNVRLRRSSQDRLAMDHVAAVLRITPDEPGWTCDPGIVFPA